MSSIIFQVQSIVIVSLLIFGVYHRKNRYKHVKIMKFAIIWDLILIVQIELSRSAIAKASKAMTNPMILNIHVSLAIATVLLYGLVFYMGRKLLHGDESKRKVHRALGTFALTTRMATLITSNLI